MKQLVVFMLVLQLYACKQVENSSTPSIVVQEKQTQFTISSHGELEAINSTPITADSKSRRPLTIAWIEKNYTTVKKDDVIIKFDGDAFQQEVDTAEFEMQKLALNKMQKQREMGLFLDDFQNEGEVVSFEFQMAKQFNIDDPLLYTKIEMIDAGSNEEFLQEKTKHLIKMEDHYQDKSKSEIGLIQSQEQLQQSKLQMNQVGLSALEVRAPHDGLFVLQKSWDGSLPQTGKSIFPGRKVAKLPDLSQMQAKLYIPEIEAVGLKEGQNVQIKLHAYPEKEFSAKITSVSKTAQTTNRSSPVKFFIVMAKINENDQNRLLPGQRLDATILTSDSKNALILPIQAVFRKGNKTWVYKKNKGKFKQHEIQIDQCSASLCMIKSGLKANDTIALTKPEAKPKTEQGA